MEVEQVNVRFPKELAVRTRADADEFRVPIQAYVQLAVGMFLGLPKKQRGAHIEPIRKKVLDRKVREAA